MESSQTVTIAPEAFPLSLVGKRNPVHGQAGFGAWGSSRLRWPSRRINHIPYLEAIRCCGMTVELPAGMLPRSSLGVQMRSGSEITVTASSSQNVDD